MVLLMNLRELPLVSRFVELVDSQFEHLKILRSVLGHLLADVICRNDGCLVMPFSGRDARCIGEHVAHGFSPLKSSLAVLQWLTYGLANLCEARPPQPEMANLVPLGQ